MTVTREDLLRAASASDDDTERLVYADWLEQTGEVARAQVIHLQCEHARTGRYDRRRFELEWEIDAVLADLGPRWKDGLPVLDGIEWLALERGLPGAVRARNVEALVTHADAIHAAAPTVTRAELAVMEVGDDEVEIPWLRTLRITGAVGANPLFDAPAELELAIGEYEEVWFARERPLQRLVIEDNATIGNELATTLADAEWARPLVTLHMPTSRGDEDSSYYDADPRMNQEGANLIATLGNLESLVVDRHTLTSKTLDGLLAMPKLRELSAREVGVTKVSVARHKGVSLDALDLSLNRIGTAGTQAIAKSPRLQQLQKLVLDTCEVEGLGLVELIRSPMWTTLRWLDLSRNPLGIGGARALAEAPRPEHLHTLLLADADFEDAAANALGKVAWLGSLLHLDLSGNIFGRAAAALRDVEPDGIRKLSLASIGMERTEAAAIARFWPKVAHLALGGNAFGDAGIERFAMREATMLQTLRLNACKLTDDALELLAERGRCPRLRSLDLSYNLFTARGMAALLRAPLLERVTSLDLSGCKLDKDAIATLARTPMPPTLARLGLRGNDLDEQQLLALATSPTLRSVAKFGLDGNPFVYSDAVRLQLEARFGENWYSDDDDEDD